MPDTHRIGWVTAIDSEKISVDLDPATTGLVKGGIAGVLPIGSINSYVTVPSGPIRLVGVVTAIRVATEPVRGLEKYSAEEAVSRRLEAILVGRFQHGEYEQGITTYPPLFAPVSPATPEEIFRIFSPGDGPTISLGEAVVAPDVDVHLDANLLLSRHCAVLGSTGSGKSSTVTALLEQLLELEIPSAHIIVFDANGEYSTAFSSQVDRGKKAKAVVIGPETGSVGGFFVPHWFMDNEDHMDVFRPGEGAQAPLLQRAVADARLGDDIDRSQLTMLLHARRLCADARAILETANPMKPQANLDALFAGLSTYLEQLSSNLEGEEANFWAEVGDIASGYSNIDLNAGSYEPLDLEQRQLVADLLAGLEERIDSEFDQLGLGTDALASNFDAPRYYSLQDLLDVFLPLRIGLESAHESRMRAYATTLLMRLSRLLADARYDFFTRVPRHADALSRFIRLLTGTNPLLDCPPEERPPWADAYEARAGENHNHSVTIIDMSLIASDVLENVTALLGRLVLDFVQKVDPRGSFPILLVLEEAHRYLPESRDTRAKAVFERIAREGRKFGVGMMMASQRPSELARTVMSQTGTLIAHRTVSPVDQDLIRHATPFANREVLRQLPGLATQHAIVLGEATRIPAYVRVRDVVDGPKSRDPDFIEMWRKEPESAGFIEEIARAWENPGG